MRETPSPLNAEIDLWFRGLGSRMMIRLGLGAGQTVLDYGCGPGRYSVPLSQVVGRNGRVLAVDKDEEALGQLRQRLTQNGQPEAVQPESTDGDGLAIFNRIEGGSFDAALLFDVLQHVPDWPTLFTQLARILKPDGRLLVYPADKPHPGVVDIKRVARLLEEHSFKTIGSASFRMMHNVEMVDDIVYSFKKVARNQ